MLLTEVFKVEVNYIPPYKITMGNKVTNLKAFHCWGEGVIRAKNMVVGVFIQEGIGDLFSVLHTQGG